MLKNISFLPISPRNAVPGQKSVNNIDGDGIQTSNLKTITNKIERDSDIEKNKGSSHVRDSRAHNEESVAENSRAKGVRVHIPGSRAHTVPQTAQMDKFNVMARNSAAPGVQIRGSGAHTEGSRDRPESSRLKESQALAGKPKERPEGISNLIDSKARTQESKDHAVESSHYMESKVLTEESKAHLEESKTHPEESKAHPKESKDHPEESKAHPEESKDHPEESKAHPEESKAHPEESKAHPEESSHIMDSKFQIVKSKNRPVESSSHVMNVTAPAVESRAIKMESGTHQQDYRTQRVETTAQKVETRAQAEDSRAHSKLLYPRARKLGRAEMSRQLTINPPENMNIAAPVKSKANTEPDRHAFKSGGRFYPPNADGQIESSHDIMRLSSLDTSGDEGGGEGGGGDGGVTVLMAACHEELEHEVRAVLTRRPTLLNLLDRTGKHAVHYCAENQQTLCIEQLVSAAAAANTGGPAVLDLHDKADGHTVLHLAVICGNLAMVKYLLQAGADVDALDNEDHSAVHWAVVCGQARILEVLSAAGAAVDLPDCHGAHPVHYAVQGCAPALEASAVRYKCRSIHFFCIFVGGLESVEYFFSLCHPFFIFERCLDSNPYS